ncbi:chemotaxis response regulator protein-glutamate methylesterase [Cupriavidus metallidurans]|uniref:Protein-glutamate methylesterase/protein-glutamine glutaminase 2 n=1 Tax=Cupriavidus metallidurans (strain ATCC 43123 / DSM 2839 / NBRC 102507 / CH34) TaxID=266264 RepID=CHEB2_CUPMC|nr:chemotaxis response regulator protein-glutamate methylesterase [Cupriavidus metallidurans]Q1LG90.1 RecName: Full=Protein-glutamate methylesterase/protein-glutamine glutaminase 2 [Cupriavidus metallidurans CH34]ABF10836.1 putative response regulator [Cupriavidus metallidurans CH34]QGS31710.1 chemotaxis-specific protein-glutamate methyltransferase CheB [Cupriavidus metallidurans]
MRIGIVNDSALAVAALRRALALDTTLEIAWIAGDGEEAVRMAATQTPDLILMDLLMPVMDGVEATRRIMAESPCAIVVVTMDLGRNANQVFDAMGHGAIDAVDTPTLTDSDTKLAAGPLLRKIRNIARLLGGRGQAPHPLAAATPTPTAPRLVAIGASAGGPAALATLLGALPADFGAAVVAVQHVDEAFAQGMAEWLDAQCQLPVRLARAGEVPQAGAVVLAGTNDHLRLTSAGRLIYTPDPCDYLYRPSIDVFFESVVEHWRGEAIGVLLTGMGRDGAQGLKAMRERGFQTIAQDQATSAVYGMPKAAATLGAASEILPLQKIAPRLVMTCGGGRR